MKTVEQATRFSEQIILTLTTKPFCNFNSTEYFPHSAISKLPLPSRKYSRIIPVDGQLVTWSTRHSYFLCDELTDGLSDVCNELTTNVKGIGHFNCKEK